MKKRTEPLLFRVDADPRQGNGHLMRCLALAQAWKAKGGAVIFLTAIRIPALRHRLKQEGMHVLSLQSKPGSQEDAQETSAQALRLTASWVVVDGYHFGSRFQTWIKQSGLHLLFVDDLGQSGPYSADVVLNQNAFASVDMYKSRGASTRLLLGLRYCLLRREFLQCRKLKRRTPRIARKILVTMGGTDFQNVTKDVLHALSLTVPGILEVVAVIGPGNPHGKDLQLLIKKFPFPVRLERNIFMMPRLMSWADLAVSGGGGTLWELAYMGVPCLVAVLAENQRLNAEWMEKTMGFPLVFSLGDIGQRRFQQEVRALALDPGVRKRMAQNLGKQIDGRGAGRVLSAIEMDPLLIREARRGDVRLLWDWANDPHVRRSSFSQGAILWKDHQMWFQEVMQDPLTKIYIGVLLSGTPIGNVRFSRQKEEAIVSMSVDGHYRGQGWGRRLLGDACRSYAVHKPAGILTALIKEDNSQSRRLFESVGFKFNGKTSVRGHPALRYRVQGEDVG